MPTGANGSFPLQSTAPTMKPYSKRQYYTCKERRSDQMRKLIEMVKKLWTSQAE